jgi:dTDP-4-dehydrorhamnose reductase
MKLLVTGGSGYLGAGILNRAPTTWQIAATYFAHQIAHGNAAAFRVDVRDADVVNRLFDEFQPDTVIHTAALMTGDKMLSVNADGSRNIARAAARLHARLIHLSSDVIFDGEHAPYDERAAPDPISPYAESKARAEFAVREECPRAVIIRTSLIYGFDPLDPRTRQVLNGEMPRLFTDEYRCPIFVDDLADALLELAENDFAGIINIAGAQRLSRNEFGVKMANAFHAAPRFEPALSASYPNRRPRDCTLDISLAQRTLRTRLRGVDEVLQRPFGFPETRRVYE